MIGKKIDNALLDEKTSPEIVIPTLDKNIAKRAIENNEMSTKEVFEILKKEIDSSSTSPEYDYCRRKILDDHSRILDDNNLTFEQKKEILESEAKVLEIATQLEKERVSNNQKIMEHAIKKDTENKKFLWGIIKIASSIIIVSVGTEFGLKYLDHK